VIPKKFATAAKAAITAGIIWVVLSHVDLAPVAARLRRLGPLEVALAILPFALQMVLAAERWRVICDRLGVALRFVPALQIVTIGTFFNQTLPSAVGGDAMRVWLLVRDRVTFGKAVNTVLCDRVFALVVLIGLSTATLPLFYRHVADPSARYGVTAFIAIGLAGVAVFLVFGTQIAHLLRRWKFSRPFGELAHDFHRLFTAPAVTASLATWSLTIHLLTVLAAWVLARVLAIDASLLDCLIVIPPVVLVMMLPVSIAGWGLREGAMVVGFGFVGIRPSDALAISICFGLASIIIGLPGGLLWLWNRQAASTEIASARD
jgi:glycosyltransferase 2 family protein